MAKNNAVWVATTCYAHLYKAQQMAEAGEKLWFGRLPFAQVARETGLDPKTVAHWYSLEQKRRLNPEFLVLCKYYGIPFKEAFALVNPDGTSIPANEVQDSDWK